MFYGFELDFEADFLMIHMIFLAVLCRLQPKVIITFFVVV